MQRNRNFRGFALYEVLLGVAIFVIGVMTLGRAVQNCLNATALTEEDSRVRQLLGNRMAELQVSPIRPDASQETKVETGYGVVRLIQKTKPADLKDADDTIIDGLSQVTLTAEWSREGVKQSKQLVFYVYRTG
jgi:Tfp pilus assembly protein PilV